MFPFCCMRRTRRRRPRAARERIGGFDNASGATERHPKASVSPASEAEEIARCEKKSVGCTVQIAESQSLRFRQQARVAVKEHRPWRRLIRKQRLDAKAAPLEGGRRANTAQLPDHESRSA